MALEFVNQIPSANNSLLWAGSFDSFSCFGVVNLTEAYANVTASVLCGVVVLNDSQLLIRDEIRAPTVVDIAASWYTVSTVSLGSDNHTATLTQGGLTMDLSLLSPSNAYLGLVDTNLCDAYSGCSELTNEGIYNIAVRLAEMTIETIIQLALTESGTTIDDFDVPLTDWNSLCTVDCWKGGNVEDLSWLDNAEIHD